MLSKIIKFSIENKLIVFLLSAFIIGFGVYSIMNIPIGAVPDVTNNQVQVITTSRNLSTQDMEQFITYPVELEMANLPGLKEIRSVSKFGLSVVTLVFDDDMGTYLPRQLIAEKIKSASDKIPSEFGAPEMGPITTGLGEIYQYVLDVKPEYKEQYSITDLRTIQDWIVKRQLSGIDGVVEVNTWGGYLKQYEVSVNSQKLMAMNISINELYAAVEKNNHVTGGGYIEKTNQSYFIRGEGLISSVEDIGAVVVKNEGGSPIYVRDVAEVREGTATRFGAITANGEGEKVMGQVMMLKGANSNKVIESVKAKVEEIAHMLPEGIYINPFLERSELIGKTMFTVSENLILGCLIVIFVVVLLLGNFRSGLVVASVIPMSLLSALSLMYVFGVDANLMSLGAIDFGIIIDGAVIIVEFIAFQITSQLATHSGEIKDIQPIKDKISHEAASKMMNSAVFGQLIILIVFIPILSLSGVEGKMFKPMALTFSFALLGAMFLCFTYVPVMASLFLKPTKNEGKGITAKFLKFLHHIYEPAILFAMKFKQLVVAISIVLLVFTVFIYTRMGGEFVPTLDEGDFVIQPVLKTGTTLAKTMDITSQIEKILIAEFPEVKQVVSRIGAAEVPTDPMSMEESDVMITLKPKSEWVNADSKDELADKFKEALSVIPGIDIEFTQPIEMRFNELITGVRADIAVKIFGEDLSVLAEKGDQIKRLVEEIPGAADVTIEKVEGLPQMNIQYDRDKIAKYGLNIMDVNQVLSLAFGGQKVGDFYEGERRFDIVLRLPEEDRRDIEDVKNLYVDLPNGHKIPLSELADISYKKGAAKISRDNTHRRIVVGINVRNRDLQSVVDDIQKVVNKEVTLPYGYYVEYGGQFENLQRASQRLLIAVPVALVLIFFMLYFAFKSVREALIIYTAIPFSAIGGVFLLWFRDLPFSISAGVGFIALFGIAVLNGIVLIEHFKEMQKKYTGNFDDMIIQGTKDRLRAVLLTAFSAALGFLPMAISTNAGAEVQRPLATVVIGGLITSTILTLIVLPVLYSMFQKREFKINSTLATVFILFGIGFTSLNGFGQSSIGLEELMNYAKENNLKLKEQNYDLLVSDAQSGSAGMVNKTDFYFMRDENNLALNNVPLNVFGAQQSFAFPSLYSANKQLAESKSEVVKTYYSLSQKEIEKSLEATYYDYQISLIRLRFFEKIDSLYLDFMNKSQKKYELGESNYLEMMTAKVKSTELKNEKQKAVFDVQNNLQILQFICQTNFDSTTIRKENKVKVVLNNADMGKSTEMLVMERELAQKESQIKVVKRERLPDFSVQAFAGINNQYLKPGFQVGVQLPIFGNYHKTQSKVAKIEYEKGIVQQENIKKDISSQRKILMNEIQKLDITVSYYENEGDELMNEILRAAEYDYKEGEIDFLEYIQSIENVYRIKLNYLSSLKEYNHTVVAYNYLFK